MTLRIAALTMAAACLATSYTLEQSFVGQARGEEPPTVQQDAVKQDAAWVTKRLEAWQPTTEERAMDRVGWAKDLREAQVLATKHGRPVFLFTYDGASLADYRC